MSHDRFKYTNQFLHIARKYYHGLTNEQYAVMMSEFPFNNILAAIDETVKAAIDADRKSWTEVRKEVREFAIQMELKLQENDYKGGWKKMAFESLFARMLEESGELLLHKACIGGNSPENEAVDVANFAMMIWDNIENPDKTDK